MARKVGRGMLEFARDYSRAQAAALAEAHRIWPECGRFI